MEVDRKLYQDLPEDRLPALVLAVNMPYKFKPGKDWTYIVHQTGGVSCHQHTMIGNLLVPKEKTLEAMKEISSTWLESDCGVFGVSLNNILAYREQLKNLLDLDCNASYGDFKEGIYPLDCSSEVIRKIAEDDVPDCLDNLINFQKDLDKYIGCINRWHLYILGENSD